MHAPASRIASGIRALIILLAFTLTTVLATATRFEATWTCLSRWPIDTGVGNRTNGALPRGIPREIGYAAISMDLRGSAPLSRFHGIALGLRAQFVIEAVPLASLPYLGDSPCFTLDDEKGLGLRADVRWSLQREPGAPGRTSGGAQTGHRTLFGGEGKER